MAYRTPGSKERGERVRDIPDGFEQLAAVAAAWTAARKALASAVTTDTVTAEAKAARRLRDLIANGQMHVPTTPTIYPPYLKGNPTKLAILLIENPKLDYRAVADRIWGPGLPFNVAKNRISSTLSTLRKFNIVTTRGSNVHEINQDRLAEVS